MKKSKEVFETIVKNNTNNTPIEFTYKNGKGKFAIYPYSVVNMKVGEFRKFMSIVNMSDDGAMITGYINSILRSIYAEVIITAKSIIATDLETDKFKNELTGYLDKLIKFNDIMLKDYEVKNIAYNLNSSEKSEISENIESNENISELKRCNVNRLIPTSVKPFNGEIVVKIGYSLEYRGMPLQIITDKGWVKNDLTCKIEIIDPVLGLPITSFNGTLSDLENKLSEVFINYLRTIESNKENVVQIANIFKKLKENVA